LPRTESVFRADARLVEVYATVTDAHGRYVDNLPREHFAVLEEDTPQRVTAFESQSAGVSVALLLDTTGSMERALPALKNAAMKLIADLRGLDAVAVYSFAENVNLLQPFTNDKEAAERAVLRTTAAGETALYDALVRVAREISGRSGKKVIVVFTDGEDNKSVLTAEAAVRRAKNTGAPVYTLAQGTALHSAPLLKSLAGIAQATGGMSFTMREPSEIRGVLERVAQDLMHGYLLVFPPASVNGKGWRRIDVRLNSGKDYRVRAREGYYPE
jgi:VWFA-related protein